MTQPIQVHIDYLLSFTSVFHFGTGLRKGLIDRVIARDADDYLYVPGSTIKGVVRNRCEQIVHLFKHPVTEPHTETSSWAEAHPDATVIAQIFGSRFLPSHVYFDDAWLIEEDRKLFEPPDHLHHKEKKIKRAQFRAWQTEKRTQVKLSRLTRTAESGALYTSEYGLSDIRFEGVISGLISGVSLFEPPGNFPLLVLVTGLRSLDHIGGNKSTGAGAISCNITNIQVDDVVISAADLLAQLEYLDKEWYDELKKEEQA